jgi:hypothetical protein
MFESAKLKVGRAEKHILDLSTFVRSASDEPNFHSIVIHEVDANWGVNDLVITFNDRDFPSTCALIVGDVLHNLRSALDLLWYEIVTVHCKGKPSKWTRFPIFDERDELKNKLQEAFETGKISQIVRDSTLDKIQPVKAVNFRLWAVDDMNITDKHQILIPTFRSTAIESIRLEDEAKGSFTLPIILLEDSCTLRLDSNVCGWHPKLIDKGCISVGIGFQRGTACEGQPVIPMLNAIKREVTHTIERFEGLLSGSTG